MKKRCTNSSCRKVFRVETHTCPYCGKYYPRANPCTDKYAVVLTHLGVSRLAVVKAIKQTCNFPLGRVGPLVLHTPSLVDTGLTQSRASMLVAIIQAAGGCAMAIPVSRGTKGIFVYRK